MKTILGIDTQSNYKPAMTLLARLGFENLNLTLATVIDPTLPYPTFEMVPNGEISTEYVRALEAAASDGLERAADEACAYRMPSERVVLSGPASPMLAEHADAIGADLIAVAATRKGALGSLFLGSVSRGLAINAHRSLLVAKGAVAPTGPLAVVLATDHSDYANRCIDRLLEMKPKGISKFIVVTGYELSDYEGTLLHANIPMLGALADDWIKERLDEKSRELVAKLSQHGYVAQHQVIKGGPSQVIREAMWSTGADLLVIGAQGHGFMDRLFMGSVSFHEVVAAPYPVLVVRV